MSSPVSQHKQREQFMQTVFSLGVKPAAEQTEERSAEVQSFLQHLPDIDQKIKNHARSWPLEAMNQIDLAILRISVYELRTKDTPIKVVLNEAIELAKTYGAEKSPSFVNGVLAAIVEEKVTAEENTHDTADKSKPARRT